MLNTFRSLVVSSIL